MAVPFVAGPFLAGLVALALKVLRGEKPQLTEVFGHFDKLMPAGIVLGVFGLVSFVFSTILFVPVLGWLLYAVLGIASPGLALIAILALGLVVDKGSAPVDALKRAFGQFMTNPLMNWLYALIIGIIAGLGYLVALIPIGIAAALFGFLGAIGGMIIAVIFGIPCLALTAPVGVLGMTAGYEELGTKEPVALKIGKQTLQIVGIALGVLLLLGIVGRLAFHWGGYALGMRGLGVLAVAAWVSVGVPALPAMKAILSRPKKAHLVLARACPRAIPKMFRFIQGPRRKAIWAAPVRTESAP